MLVEIDKKILIYLQENRCISIQQCRRLFYRFSQDGIPFSEKDGYTYARRKLRHLEVEGHLKSYDNAITKQKVYYTDKKLSAHDLYKLDFYTKLIEMGCQVLEFKKNPVYLNGNLKPDGFFLAAKDNHVFMCLLEVDYGHVSDMCRMQMYEKLYREADWKKEFYGKFPQVVVMGINPLKYCSNNFTVIRLDLECKGFNQVLSLKNTSY